MSSLLTVIYGPPLAGKTTLAWQLARSLPGKTAVVSSDQLLSGSIAVSDADALAELEMAHVQLRLLVVNYLKNRYHVVVEGPFCFEREGRLHSFEPEIDQQVALMRNLTSRTLLLHLDASEAVLSQRASATGRETELPVALQMRGGYKARYGERFLALDSGELSLDAMVAAANERLFSEAPV